MKLITKYLDVNEWYHGGVKMSEKVKNAIELFSSGYGCAQSVFSSFCNRYGLESKTALKVACGFAGGLRSGEVCGAVSGAIMVIGLRYGQCELEDKTAKEKCYELTLEFMKRYEKEENTTLCREILGFDIRDSVARKKFPGKIKEVCPKAIEHAVLILEDMGF